jgi:CBS domain-containing protein
MKEETTMNVGKTCQKNPVTIRPFDDLTAAAQLMREKHVGYLVVVEPSVRDSAFAPVGVLTDRDIVVSVVAREADARTLRAGDVMTREPVVATEDESLGSALKKMRKVGVRRLPVVGQHGEIVGVISLDDIIDALVGELEDAAGAIRSEQLIEHSLRP